MRVAKGAAVGAMPGDGAAAAAGAAAALRVPAAAAGAVAALRAVGMAPLCFAQAYLAQTLFEWLPDGPWLLAAAVIATAIAAWLALRKG